MAGVGAQLYQPPVVLINTANAITQKYFAPVLADSIFKPSPTWWKMVRDNKKVSGGAMVWPVISAEETAGGAYYGTQNLDTSAQDSSQPAEMEWKFYYQNISIPGTDLVLNDGPQQVISLVRAKEEIAMGSLLQKLSRAIYGVSPQNTALDLDSLAAACAASGTYAGITLSSAFWLCNGLNGPSSGGATSLPNMQTDYGNATQGNEEPDTITMRQSGWNAFWALLTNQQRQIRDEETTRAGFKNHLMFNNATVLHDAFVPSGEQYFLTSKYLEPCFHPARYFKVMPFIMPTNQDMLISKIYVTLNVKCLTLRQHSRRTGVTDAA